MIEINRWLYLGEDYSVDSERTKTLVSVLRRVAEVLKENEFRNAGGQIGTEILIALLSAMDFQKTKLANPL